MFKFPYTNLHELNLDWILEKVKKFAELIPPMETAVDDVQALTDDVAQAVEDANQAVEDAQSAIETAEEAKEIAEQAAQGTIVDGAVITSKIADGAVTTAKIADGAVTGNKIGTATIKTGNLSQGCVTSNQILDGTVATSDIADNAITTVKINDEAVTQAKLDNSLSSLVDSLNNSNVIEQTNQDSINLEYVFLPAIGQYDQVRFFVNFPFVTKNTNYTITGAALEITNVGAVSLNVHYKTKNGFSAYGSVTGATGALTVSSLTFTVNFSDT